MPHQPVCRIIPGADTAVLFVHGIIGTPNHFLPLLPDVPENFSYCNILLDGHGGDVRAFSHTRMDIWRQQTEDIALELLKTHKRLYIVAHSMGTLFAINIALKYPDRIAGLFLLAVPLRIAFDPRVIPGMLRIAIGRIPASDVWALRTREAYGLDADPRLWRYIGWIPRYIELFAEVHRVRKLVPLLTTCTLVFPSDHDEMVSRRSADFFTPLSCAKVIPLPDSGHYSYSEPALALLKKQLHDFLK